MTSQLVIIEVRGPVPIILTFIALVVLLFAAYGLARIYTARHYSKKNMPKLAQEKINELALNLANAVNEKEWIAAENQILWGRYTELAALTTKPLDIKQAREELKIAKRKRA